MTGPFVRVVDFIVFNLSNDGCGVARGDRERGHVFSDDGARADNRAVSDSYAGQDYGIETDPNIASDADRLGRSVTRHPARTNEGYSLELRTALFRIGRNPIGVHEHHVPRDETIIADLDCGIANKPGPMDERKPSDGDAAPRTDIEHGAEVS